MDDKRIKDNDAYDELLKSFSSTAERSLSDDEIKNRGEIYFSMNTPNNNAERKTSKPVRSEPSGQSPVRKKRVNSEKAKTRKKATKKKSGLQNSIVAILVVVIVFVCAFLVKIPLMGCINDILAIDVSNTDFRVVLDKDMDVYETIDILADKDLINNPMFCKLFAKIRNFDVRVDKNKNVRTIVYPAGTYFLNSAMGVEGMLNEIRTNGADVNTIKLTFPEGFSVEQIIEKLDSNGVCSASSLYDAMMNDELFAKYEFLNSVTDKNLRFRLLEGYLYPDTYEFYIGESAASVIDRFLKNFDEKWSDAYKARAAELGYTVDEIITVATILEKEAFDAEQMPVIAGVLYNRLGSSSFPFINCDSTAQYIENFRETLEANGTYAEYMKVYDTYQKTGLPVGPICCPGADAIYAALYPDSNDYYYFLHDKDGKIYLASTSAEHQNNLQYVE